MRLVVKLSHWNDLVRST